MSCTDRKKTLLLILFVFALAFSFTSAPLTNAQSYFSGTLTINANNTECDSIYIYDSEGNSDTITSFPGSYDVYVNPWAGPTTIVFTVTAEADYAFTYATSSSASYLTNPFADNFYGDDTITVNFTSTIAPTPTPAPTGYEYIFNGCYDENNYNTYLGNVTVTAYYPNGSVGLGGKSIENFNVAGTYTYRPPSQPLYFSYNLTKFYSENLTRQYWLGYQENTATIDIYSSQNEVATTVFSIFNYKNIAAFDSGAILTAKSVSTGNTIDRRLVDSLGTTTLELQTNTLYDITVESLSTGSVYDLGNINTATTLITLNVPSNAFPDDIVDLYTYSYAYAYRNFTTGSIIIMYEDTTSNTTSLEIIISDADNSTVYFDQTYTESVNDFSYSYAFAVNETNYNVWVIVQSETVGQYYFKQYLGGLYDTASSPFDFSFMGSISGLDMAVFLPAFIIICAAGVFSQLTAEFAAFATSITAVILVMIGWISISSSMLVIALSLSLLAGVITARRRFA